MTIGETPIIRIETDVPIDHPDPSHVRIICKLCSAMLMEVVIAEREDVTFQARMDREMPALIFAHFGGVHKMDVPV